MKFSTLLPLVAIGSAFVIVDEAVLNKVVIESKETPKTFLDKLPSKDDIASYVEETFEGVAAFSGSALDKAFSAVSDAASNAAFQCHSSMTAFDVQAWLNSAVSPFGDATDTEEVDAFDILEIMEAYEDHPKRPHHGHKKPHHHHKPNLTIWEIISTSKYTTKLAKALSEFDDLVGVLNGTSSNITLFAPTDKAFERLPDHHKKPNKELIHNVLRYHVSPEFYPAGRVLLSHTIPSAYSEERLGGEAQRLRVGFNIIKGLNINFFSRVVAANIFATNGVIHGVDHIISPPPPIWKIVELLPGEFSTLQLALVKTGLDDDIKNIPHSGGTFFAPNNLAFRKLGPRINAFLFSKRGEKYLKAILRYHAVVNETLYSDAFYKAEEAQELINEVGQEMIPKGVFHVDLPTALEGKSLSVDIARYGGLITIRINGFVDVAVQDGIASDGVIQVLNTVLIPPKSVGGKASADADLTIEELQERLDPYVEELYVKEKSWWEL